MYNGDNAFSEWKKTKSPGNTTCFVYDSRPIHFQLLIDPSLSYQNITLRKISPASNSMLQDLYNKCVVNQIPMEFDSESLTLHTHDEFFAQAFINAIHTSIPFSPHDKKELFDLTSSPLIRENLRLKTENIALRNETYLLKKEYATLGVRLPTPNTNSSSKNTPSFFKLRPNPNIKDDNSVEFPVISPKPS